MLSEEIKQRLEELKDCKKLLFNMVGDVQKVVFTSTIYNNAEQEFITGTCVYEPTNALLPYNSIIEIQPDTFC